MSEVAARSGLATEHTRADSSPGLLLWRVTNRWQAAQRATLKPFGLTHVQFVLLASLTYLDVDASTNPEPDADDHPRVTQRALAEHAATDEMMTSQVLRALESKGLVKRRPDPRDRRARMLTVTPAGRGLANRAVVAVEACDRAFFAAAGDRQAVLTDLLASLAAAPTP